MKSVIISNVPAIAFIHRIISPSLMKFFEELLKTKKILLFRNINRTNAVIQMNLIFIIAEYIRVGNEKFTTMIRLAYKKS